MLGPKPRWIVLRRAHANPVCIKLKRCDLRVHCYYTKRYHDSLNNLVPDVVLGTDQDVLEERQRLKLKTHNGASCI